MQEGVETVLVDKRDIGAGSTAASTELLQYEIDTELHELIGTVGEAHAVRSYRLGLEAIDTLERLSGELKDDCGFERKTSHYLASRNSDLTKLPKEYDTRKSFGFHVEYLKGKDIKSRASFTAPGAILSYGDAQVDPYRLTHQLLEAAKKQGLVSTTAPSYPSWSLPMTVSFCTWGPVLESMDNESYLRRATSPGNTSNRMSASSRARSH
jgi:glycine/D-amino acid oxidase-like deaminating enzyme